MLLHQRRKQARIVMMRRVVVGFMRQRGEGVRIVMRPRLVLGRHDGIGTAILSAVMTFRSEIQWHDRAMTILSAVTRR